MYFMHDWGIDQLNRTRAGALNAKLQSLAIKTWFDEQKLFGNIQQKMCDGSDNSAIVIIGVSARFLSKVAGKGDKCEMDNCRYEFAHASNTKQPARFIPVVMEPRCIDTAICYGKVSAVLGGHLFVNFADDALLESDIVKKLMSKLKGS